MVPRAKLPESMSELKRVRGPDAQAEARPAEAPSDQQVIAALRMGQEWAAEALYDRLQPVVDRALRRVLQSQAGQDDQAQVVFERIIVSLMGQRFEGACSLSTWATAIATHVAIDALRARVRERAFVLDDRARGAEHAARVSSGSLERQLEARAEIAELHVILGGMDAVQAETVLLHDVYGHELSEIGQLMGVSVAAAQSRLVRGRKELLRRARVRLGREQ